jgi:hypothetical protein
MAVNADFLAELFVVACRKSCDGCAIDTLELASWIIEVKNIVSRILSIYSFAVAAFYHVNAIVLTIK